MHPELARAQPDSAFAPKHIKEIFCDQALNQVHESLLQQKTADAITGEFFITSEALQQEFCVHPVFQGDALCALTWFLILDNPRYQRSKNELFHRSQIPHWVIDGEDLMHYLDSLDCLDSSRLHQYFYAHQDFVPTVKQIIYVSMINDAASQLFGLNPTVQLLSEQFIACLSDDDVYHLCQMMVSVQQGIPRYAYFSDFARIKGDEKSYLVNAELPSKTNISHGLLMNCVDMTPINLSDRLLNDRKQLATRVLEKMADDLLIFDVNQGAFLEDVEHESLLAFELNEINQLNKNFIFRLVDKSQLDTLFEIDQLTQELDKQGQCTVKRMIRLAEGQEVFYSFTAFPLSSDVFGRLLSVIVIVREDVDMQGVEDQRQLALQVFDNTMDGMFVTSTEGRIIQANKAFEVITGFETQAVLNEKPSILNSGWRDTSFSKDIYPKVKEDGYWQGEIMSRRLDGEAFQAQVRISSLFDNKGHSLGLMTTFRDITKTKDNNENIKKLAYFDPLTKLPNRTLFYDRLEQAIKRGNRSRLYVAILFIDLDGFKAINDSLGHANGDRLLTEVGKRIKNTIRSDDTVARLGGDEFTIILNGLANKEVAESATALIAQKVVKSLAQPFSLQNTRISIGCSIGISIYPDDSIHPDELIKHADTAMYHVKQQGKNGYEFYREDLSQSKEIKNKLESDLLAIDFDEEMSFIVKPGFNAEKKLTHLDMQLQWHHSDRGVINQKAFISQAEELGLTTALGDWVILSACQKISETKLPKPIRLTVPVFERHYREGYLTKLFKKQLGDSKKACKQLTLEMPLSLLMQDVGYAFATLSDIKALGVRIAVTGFGNATFSLMSVNRLPIDEVRIESQLIRHMNKSKDDQKLIKGIIHLSDYLAVDIVSTGVERRVQLTKLKSLFEGFSGNHGFSQNTTSAFDELILDKIKPVFTS
ncbi:MAG: diguanylate cyclase [Cellvibrionales bacterium]|nr:diguanylate cyclase [Cellvibrionales bacterium]